MSMNLAARTAAGPVDLRQTPTQISYTILPPIRDGIEPPRYDAREALLRYMEWVRYSNDGVWHSEAELNEADADAAGHLRYIESVIDDPTLEVWVE